MVAASVLIVDDNKLIIEPLVEYLSMEGMNVTWAETGQKALSFLQQVGFDWVLTDIVMPDMDGIELLRVIRRNWPLVKCIAWSGAGHKEHYLNLADVLGARKVLQKPILPSSLVEIIKAG